MFYGQSSRKPILLSGDLMIELALKPKYVIVTVLTFSKCNFPVFAQRKPNGRLRLHMDLRRIDIVVANGYRQNGLTDKKIVTGFFRKKSLCSSLWNPFDHVLHFQFKIVYNAASIRTPAYFLLRLKINVTEKIQLKVREDIQTTPIELTKSHSDVTQGEYFFSTRPDNKNETKEQTHKRKKTQMNAANGVANQEPSPMMTIIKEMPETDGNSKSYSIIGIKAKARMQVY